MATPQEIQQNLTNLHGQDAAIRAYLQSLSPEDIAAWQHSVDRTNAGQPKGVGGFVSAVAPFAAPFAATAAGAAGGVSAVLAPLGALVGPTRAAVMLDALGPIGENTIRVIPAGRVVSASRILKVAGLLGTTAAIANGIAAQMSDKEIDDLGGDGGGDGGGGQDVVGLLGKAGYRWSPLNKPGAGGDTALWVGPDGRTVTEAQAIVSVANAGQPNTATASTLIDWFVDRATKNGISVTPKQARAELFGEDGYLTEFGKSVSAEFARTALDATKPTGPNGGFGFAPQAKSSGVLPSGRPYVFDPNAPRGSQFADGITGGPLSPADFNALPAQVQGNDGYLYFVDPLTKAVTKGPLIGFAGIDPAVTAAESKRRFDVEEGGRNTRNTQSEQEANRRELLKAQSQGFQSVNQLAPQLGTLALEGAKFTKDTLRSAPDYLARAFFQQGQTSPLPQVSQADINNQLVDLFTRYNQTLSGFNVGTPAIGGFQTAPAGGVPPATQPGLQSFTPPEGSANPAAAGLAGFLAANPGFGGNLQPAAGAAPAQTSAAALTFDPTGGPTGQGGWSQGGQPVADAFSAFGAQQAAPQASFTPVAIPQAPQISFAPPQLPVPQRQTQAQLQALERSVRPPAVNAVMSGESAKPPQFGFSLPTVQNLNSLTTEDKQAYNTALGTQFNETLDNVQNEVARRTRNPESRRRAVVTGFQ